MYRNYVMQAKSKLPTIIIISHSFLHYLRILMYVCYVMLAVDVIKHVLLERELMHWLIELEFTVIC